MITTSQYGLILTPNPNPSMVNEQFTTQCKRHDSSSQKKVEKYAVWELFGGISHM